MFDNIAKLRFEEGAGQEMLASAMLSSEAEIMEFRQPVAAEGRVEDWMTNVLNEMRRTNRLITKEAIFKYGGEMSRYLLHLFPRFTPAFRVTCIGDIFRPSFDMPLNWLKDPLTVKLVIFRLLAEQMTNKWLILTSNGRRRLWTFFQVYKMHKTICV